MDEMREDDICLSSNLVDVYIQDVKEENVKMENAEIKGKIYVHRHFTLLLVLYNAISSLIHFYLQNVKFDFFNFTLQSFSSKL